MTPLFFYRTRPTRVPFIGVPIGPFAALAFACGLGVIVFDGFASIGVATGVLVVGTMALRAITEYDERALSHIGKRFICRWWHLDRTYGYWRASSYAPVVQGARWERRRRKW